MRTFRQLVKKLRLSIMLLIVALIVFAAVLACASPVQAVGGLPLLGFMGAVAFPAKFPTNKHIVCRNKALTKNGTTVISNEIPIGDGHYSYLLDFKNVFTVGTGTTAKSEGELRAIKDIMMRTDRDGIIFKATGRQLFRRAQKLMGSAPYKDAIAASNNTYWAYVPIHFANRRLRRPEDTIINSARYRTIEIHITMGSEADLLGTVGTSSATWTLDFVIEKTHNAVDETNAPLMLPFIMGLPPMDPNTLQYIELEKNPALSLFDVTLFTSNTDVTAGIPASGTAADNIADNVTLYDNIKSTFRNVPFKMLQHDNVTKFDLSGGVVTGQVILDLIEDGSMLSGMPTGDKAVLQAQWVNDTPAGGQVTALLDGQRAFNA